jgi:hypothetical protein
MPNSKTRSLRSIKKTQISLPSPINLNVKSSAQNTGKLSEDEKVQFIYLFGLLIDYRLETNQEAKQKLKTSIEGLLSKINYPEIENNNDIPDVFKPSKSKTKNFVRRTSSIKRSKPSSQTMNLFSNNELKMLGTPEGVEEMKRIMSILQK